MKKILNLILVLIIAAFCCKSDAMTFEEAYGTMLAGEPLDIILMFAQGAPVVVHCVVIFVGLAMNGTPTIEIDEPGTGLMLFWSTDGIYNPDSGGGSVQ